MKIVVYLAETIIGTLNPAGVTIGGLNNLKYVVGSPGQCIAQIHWMDMQHLPNVYGS
jgi:hypothetical protein